jgi:hypothetical protein
LTEQAPIAFVVFNRPEPTAISFAAIARQRPGRLLVIADGPRASHSGDAERCRQVQQLVQRVDWPCNVSTNFAPTNQGLKRRVSSGLDWVFEQVDRAIVLEDDCVPHPDFFAFCNALLEQYADDGRVSAITGDNFQDGQPRGEAAYYFSKYNHVWGWASWRRAWQSYDVSMAYWPAWRDSREWAVSNPDPVERRYWEGIFDRVYRGEIQTWDYQWMAACWRAGGLTATPNRNLVENIGGGPDATHPTAAADMPGRPAEPLGVLVHPSAVERDEAADKYVFDHAFGGREMRMSRVRRRWTRLVAGRRARGESPGDGGQGLREAKR